MKNVKGSEREGSHKETLQCSWSHSVTSPMNPNRDQINGQHRGRTDAQRKEASQRQSQLENDQSFVINFKLIIVILLASEFP